MSLKSLSPIKVGQYTLPTSDGSNGQVLTTDGSGNVSFTTVVTDDKYLSGLSFNTSNGVLTATVANGSSVTTDLDGRYVPLSGGTITGVLSITSDGSNAATLTESGNGDFTIAAVDDIRLDAGGNDIVLRGASSQEFARLGNDSGNFRIRNITSDKDINIEGNDGGVTITALSLDMSAAGHATFNRGITAKTSTAGDWGLTLNTGNGDNMKLSVADTGTAGAAHAKFSSSDGDIILDSAKDITLDAAGNDIRFFKNGVEYGKFKQDSSHFDIFASVQDKDIRFKGNDGGSTITALTLDMSGAGYATFNSGIQATNTYFTGTMNVASPIYHVGDTNTYFGFSANDTFIVTTGGTNALTIDSSQNATYNKYIKLDDPAANATGRQIHFVAISGESNTEPFRITRWQDKMYFTYGHNSGDESFWVNSDGTVNFEEDVTFVGDLNVESASTNSEDVLNLKSGADNVDEYLGLTFTTGVGGSGPHGAIRVYNGPSASDAYMSFLTTTNGGTLTQGLTLDHLGNATFAGTIASQDITSGNIRINESSNPNLQLYRSSSTTQLWELSIDSSGRLLFQEAASSGGTQYTRFQIDDTGEAEFTGDLTVGGNLIVNGTTTTINTATVEVEDNILQLNTTQGSPDTATAGTSGISVYRGDGVTQASLIFDDADDTWDLTNKLVVGGTVYVDSDLKVRGTSGEDHFIIAPQAAGSGTILISYNNGETGYEPLVVDAETFAFRHSGTPIISTSGTTTTFAGNVEIPSGYVGRDAHNRVDFQTDDVIHYRVQDSYMYRMDAAGFRPYTDSTHDLGGSSYYWKHAYIDAITTTGAITASGDIQAPGIYVGSTNTSFDFYNNGTTYLNGATIVDALLTVNNAVNIESASGGRYMTLDAPTLGAYITFETGGTAYADIGSASAIVGSGADTDTLMIKGRSGKEIALGAGGTEAIRINTSQNTTFAGLLYLPDGSVSAPSISNTGDTNTGMYWPGDHQVGFAVNGSRKFYMSQTQGYFQNLSGGITISAGGIDVTGDSTFSGAVTFAGGSIASNTIVLNTGNNVMYMRGGSAGLLIANGDGTDSYYITTSDHRWEVGGGEKMRLNSNQLLLNATSSSMSNDKLYVNGDGYATGGWRTGTSSTYVGKLTNSSGILTLQSDTNRDIQFGDAGTPAIMYIDTSTEMVGIGTVTPVQPLHIVNTDGANIILNSNTGAENNGIWMTEGAAASPYTNGAYLHYDSTANALKINTGTTTLSTRFTMARDTGATTFAGSLSSDTLSAANGITSGGLLMLQSTLQVLNKAQTSYINLAARDTSGSEVVYNLSNLGTATFAGNVTVDGATLTHKRIQGTVTESALSGTATASALLTTNYTHTGTNNNGAYARQDYLNLAGSGGSFANVAGYQMKTNVTSTGTSTAIKNIMSRVHTASAGDINNVTHFVTHNEFAGTGNVGNWIGLGVAEGGGGFENTQTITNTYGIKIGDITHGTQTNAPYAIHTGSERIYFGGNVGIGAQTPEKKLHVLTATTDHTPQVLIQNSNTGDANLMFNISGDSYSVGIDNSDGDKFKISAGNLGTNDRITIRDDGNVGIGQSNPAQKLHVGGHAIISGVVQPNYIETQASTRNALLGNTMIGSKTIDPDRTLHVWKASAGTVVASSDAQLVVENSGVAAINLLSPATSHGQIIFGDPDDNDVGQFGYDHATNTMYFKVNGSSTKVFKVDSTGATFTGTLTTGNITTNSRLTFDYNGSGSGNNYLESGTNTWNFKNSGATTAFQINHSDQSASVTGNLFVGGNITGINSRNIVFDQNSTNYIYALGGTSAKLQLMATHSLRFHTSASQTEALVIDSSQNSTFAGTVGIGTTANSTYDLDIFRDGNAAARIRGNGQAALVIDSDSDNDGQAGAYLKYQDNGANKWILYKETNNDFYLYNLAANKYPIHAKANGHIVLMEDGNNLGVGVSSPGYKLEVGEDTDGTADLLMLRNSDATYAQTWAFQSDTNKDLVITGSSGAGGFKFVPGSRGSTFTGDVTVTGDLNVTGITTATNVVNLDVSDNIIGLNRGSTSNANDSGLIIERGSTGNNAAFLWDEGDDAFVFGTTTANPAATGNITYAFAPIKAGAVTTTGTLTVNSGHVNLDAGMSLSWDNTHERIEQSDGHLEFFINNGEAMTLDTDGLGIGTTDPTSRLSLSGQQSLLDLTRATSGDAKFFISADSARLYFTHTDIQSTNQILKLDASDESATFAGKVYVANNLEVQNNSLQVRDTSSNLQIKLQASVGGTSRIMAHNTNIGTNHDLDIVSTQIDLQTGSISGSDNSSALLLDSSRNAIFKGIVSVPTGKTFRLYNAAGSGWAEIYFNESDNKVQFNRGIQPSGNGQSDQNLGLSSKKWNEVHAVTYYGSGANLTGITATLPNPLTTNLYFNNAVRSIVWPHTSGQSSSRAYAWVGEQGAYGRFGLRSSNAADDTIDTDVVYFQGGDATFAGDLNLISASSPTIQVKDTTNNCKLLMYSQDSSSIIGTYSGHPMSFYTDSGETMKLNTDHSVYFTGNLKGPSDILSVYNRVKISVSSNHQLNIGQWDTANHRIEGDANRPIMITSYQGNINLGTSGSTKLNVNTSGIAVTGTGTFTGNLTANNLSGTNTGDQTLPTASSLGAVTLTGTQTISGAKTFTSVSNTFNGHLYYTAYDSQGQHYPHFRDGTANNGADINWRHYYGSSYKTHTWTSDSSGNMLFTYQGGITAVGGLAGTTGTFTGNVLINKNTPVLTLGVGNTTTGNAKITFNSKNTNGNAYSLQYNKTTSVDRMEFIDGSGNPNIYFENGGSAYFASNVTINGNLNITGDINSTSVTNLDVTDKTITVAKGAADSAAADGAGIVVDGADAELLYDHTGEQWEFNKPVEFDGAVIIDKLGSHGRIRAGGSMFLGGGGTTSLIQFSGDAIPDSTNSHDLGSSTRYWGSAYINTITTTGLITAGGLTVDGAVNLDVMPTHESEGIIRIGRYDANTSRYHNIKSYVSSTTASNYLKFSLHNGTANTVADVLTLNGDLSAEFAGNISLTGGGIIQAPSSSGSEGLTFKAAGGVDVLIDSNGNSGDDQTFRVLKHSINSSSALLTVTEKGTLERKNTIGKTLSGSKAVTLVENTYTDVLTVSMANHTGCYVKIFVTGDWSSHSAAQYLGEYFLTNGAGGYGEPGMIIREVDNTSTDTIVAKLVDPTGTSGNRDFKIQLLANDTLNANGFSAKITYEVMGQYVSVS